MKALAVFAVLAIPVPLSGCLTSAIAKMTPEQQIGMIDAFREAGCSGSIHASAGAGTGQLGGGAHGEFSLDGSCKASDAAVVVPLRDVDKLPAS